LRHEFALEWDPELDSCARAWLAFDLVKAAGHEGTLPQCEQPEVAREVAALGHVEALAVVLDDAQDAVIQLSKRNLDERRLSVTLDVAERFGNLSKDQGAVVGTDLSREVDLELVANSPHLEHGDPVSDRLREPVGGLEGGRSNLEDEPSQGRFRLLQQAAERLECLTVDVALLRSPRDQQLSRGQLLQGVV